MLLVRSRRSTNWEKQVFSSLDALSWKYAHHLNASWTKRETRETTSSKHKQTTTDSSPPRHHSPPKTSVGKQSIQSQYSWSARGDTRRGSLAFDEKSRETRRCAAKPNPELCKAISFKLLLLAAFGEEPGLTSTSVNTSPSFQRRTVRYGAPPCGHSEMTLALLPAHWPRQTAPASREETQHLSGQTLQGLLMERGFK